MKKCVRYTKEETEWVKKFFPILESNELQKEYSKVFKTKRSARALDSFGKFLGLRKETTNWFSEEETEWIVKNYGAYEPAEITYKKFCDLFGTRHPPIAFDGKVKQLHLHKGKPMTMLQYRYLQTHEELPKDSYLVDCCGEVIDIPKDIYNCLNGRHLLGQGEITKTMVEIYKAKKQIENLTHKRVFQYMPTKEHIAKMNSVPKTYHKKFDDEKANELKEMVLKGFSKRKLATHFGVSTTCIRTTLKRLESEKEKVETNVMKTKIRIAQVPVGATFKYLNVLYLKNHDVLGKNVARDYEDNCVRLDNQKSMRLHGSYLVEVE